MNKEDLLDSPIQDLDEAFPHFETVESVVMRLPMEETAVEAPMSLLLEDECTCELCGNSIPFGESLCKECEAVGDGIWCSCCGEVLETEEESYLGFCTMCAVRMATTDELSDSPGGVPFPIPISVFTEVVGTSLLTFVGNLDVAAQLWNAALDACPAEPYQNKKIYFCEGCEEYHILQDGHKARKCLKCGAFSCIEERGMVYCPKCGNLE